jgi:transmembrane sensor
MDPSHDRLRILFERYTSGEISPKEQSELMRLIASGDQDEEVKALLNSFKTARPAAMNPARKKDILQSILAEGEEIQPEKQPGTGRFFVRTIRVAASIALLVFVGYSVYTLFPYEPKQIATVPPEVVTKPTDTPILRLADGSQVKLTDSSRAIPQQGTANVQNKKGLLSYEVEASKANSEKQVVEVVYNEVFTPPGGQYHLTLSDGSKVWLNASSSLKFPAAFSGDKREVQLTGEAYFEIAHNEAMPFHVKTPNGMDVRVLGTHFNVMAYSDEETIKTTLLEGSVRVTTASAKSILLVPGEQASLSQSDELALAKDADIAQTMAWRDNKFIFRNAEIHEIMRELARWYDLEVTYKGEVKDVFVSTLPRAMKINEVLEILELAGGVKFELNGKNVIVIGE